MNLEESSGYFSCFEVLLSALPKHDRVTTCKMYVCGLGQ